MLERFLPVYTHARTHTDTLKKDEHFSQILRFPIKIQLVTITHAFGFGKSIFLGRGAKEREWDGA